MHIYIVDDNISHAYHLKESLAALSESDHRMDPFSCDVFHDGSEFLEYLETKRKSERSGFKLPDLILLDIQMPKKNGLETYMALHRERDSILSKIHFCSSVSFGAFENFFMMKQMPIPPFTPKSQVFQVLVKIIEPYIPAGQKIGVDPDPELAQLPRPLLLQLNNQLTEALKLLDELETHTSWTVEGFPKWQTGLHALSGALQLLPELDLTHRWNLFLQDLETAKVATAPKNRSKLRALLKDAQKIHERLVVFL